jgi:Chaperone of endosialidase
MNKHLILSAAAIAASLSVSLQAKAAVCGSNSCAADETTISYTAASSTAFSVDNSGGGSSAIGISGDVSANLVGGIGVEGTSEYGTGVRGVSTDGNGVWGSSATTTATQGGVTGSNTGGGNGVYGTCSGGAGCFAGYFNGSVTVASGSSYYYNGTATCVAGFCASDQRFKKNVAPLTGATDKLLQLKGVTFEWNNPEEHGNQAGVQTGFIAQEVEKVFPGWVDENNKGMKGIVLPPMQLAALQIEAFREQKAEIDALKAQVKALEDNRRPMISLNTAGGTLFGFGLAAMAGAVVISRRKRSESDSKK